MMSRHGLKTSFGLSLSGPQYGSASSSSDVMSTPSNRELDIHYSSCVWAKTPPLKKAELLEEAYQVHLVTDSSTRHKVGNLLQNPCILPFHVSRMIYNHKYQF